MKKYLQKFYNYFYHIDFYNKINFKLELLEKEFNIAIKEDFEDKFKSGQFYLNDKISKEHLEKTEFFNKEIIRLKKLSKEFKFEFNYSYGTSYLCTIILFCCLSFMLKNYFIDFLLPNYYTPFFISLNLFYFVFSLFVYKYWIKQTSIYYEQFI